jgi:hypothetical protein
MPYRPPSVRSLGDSRVFFQYASFLYWLDLLLNCPDLNLLYRADYAEIVRLNDCGILHACLFYSFESVCLLGKVIETFRKIELDEVNNQEDIARFYCWLRDVFVPFLGRVELVIPDIFTQVNDFFQKGRAPTLEMMLKGLMIHFSEVPLCILRAIFLRNLRRMHVRKFTNAEFPRVTTFIGFAMAKMQGKNLSSWDIEQKDVGLTHYDACIFLKKMRHVGLIQGRLFRGRLLSLSIAQKLLINRLSHGSGEECCDMFSLFMRVLSGSFPYS